MKKAERRPRTARNVSLSVDFMLFALVRLLTTGGDDIRSLMYEKATRVLFVWIFSLVQLVEFVVMANSYLLEITHFISVCVSFLSAIKSSGNNEGSVFLPGERKGIHYSKNTKRVF